MNPLKRLASQTLVYGLSSIVARFLNYLMFPLYTYVFTKAQYGTVSELYAYSGFLAVLLIFGLETGFFRFIQNAESKKKVYSTALNAALIGNLTFLTLLLVFIHPIANALRYSNHYLYFYCFGFIMFFDSICLIPFARLRYQNKALKFATIKFIEIMVFVGLNLFFLALCKPAYDHDPNSFFGRLYNPDINVGYIFISELVSSVVKFILLIPMFRSIKWGIDKELLNKMIRYSMPMLVIGFAGIINEMLDRALLKFLLPFDNTTNMQMLGIYGACYKLSILMSLFIQAFRYAAEPFFFAQAQEKDSKGTYATVMNYFVIICVAVFLLVMLYMEWIQHFIGPAFRVGLGVVPILLMANLFLGVYVNLSIWYKLTDKTMMGAWVSLGGAALTIVLNILWIPTIGYVGSAWATFFCYFAMAVVSYLLGRRYFPVNYDLKKIGGYIVLGLLIWQAFELSAKYVFTNVPFYIVSTGFMLLFFAVAWFFDGRRLLQRNPA